MVWLFRGRLVKLNVLSSHRFDGFLSKAFDKESLISKIKEVLKTKMT
jgi:hypothetical protein